MKIIDSNGNQFTLNTSKSIGAGGEGTIYPVSATKVVKIHHTPRDTPEEGKVKALSTSQLNPDWFLKPLELVYADAPGRTFVGFTMDLLPKSFKPLFEFLTPQFLTDNKIDPKKVELIIDSMALVIENAHKSGVVIGDFNSLNVYINPKTLEIKVIDIGAFGIGNWKHSGKADPAITDYQRGGLIDQSSDWWAHAIHAFNLLTGIHPFKGIHSTVRTLQDRIISKISVLNGDPKLIIPRVYKPTSLSSAFKDILEGGKRHRINLKGQVFAAAVVKLQPIANLTDVIVTKLAGNIKRIRWGEQFVAIETSENIWTILQCISKGATTVIRQDVKADDILIGKTSVYYMNSVGEIFTLEGLKTNMVLYGDYAKNGSFVTVLDHGSLRVFNLDARFVDSVSMQSMQVFTQSMNVHKTVVTQSFGKMGNILKPSEKGINTVMTNFPQLITCQINRNIGVLGYRTGTNIEFQWIKFQEDGITFITGSKEEVMPSFTVNNAGTVFVAEDGFIKVMQDFHTVARIECAVMQAGANIHITESGIHAQVDDSVYLINKK